jgi:hypothetical protein
MHAFGGMDSLAADSTAFIDASGMFNDAGATDVVNNEAQQWGQWANNDKTRGKYGLSNFSGSQTGPTNNFDGYNSVTGTNTTSTVSDAGSFVLTETSLDMHCWGENPVVTAKLQLNGNDRFSEREGTYFDLVQPWQHHTRAPDTGINCYSFALRPEEHQPSGSCNFSRIDNATFQLILSSATVQGTRTAKVRVYAVNYNVLRIMSGMGGMAYSN